jgi:hypothetical protein
MYSTGFTHNWHGKMLKAVFVRKYDVDLNFDTGCYTMAHAVEYYLTVVLYRLHRGTLNRGSTVHCLYFYSWDGVRLRVLWYCSHKWAYCTSPWWQIREWSSCWTDNWREKLKHSERNLPPLSLQYSTTFSVPFCSRIHSHLSLQLFKHINAYPSF